LVIANSKKVVITPSAVDMWVPTGESYSVFFGARPKRATGTTQLNGCTRTTPTDINASNNCARSQAKFWLDPVSLAFNRGFAAHELNRVEARVNENRETLIEAWNEFFAH
jgi:hypothetical protein